jgi:hypothetical protein
MQTSTRCSINPLASGSWAPRTIGTKLPRASSLCHHHVWLCQVVFGTPQMMRCRWYCRSNNSCAGITRYHTCICCSTRHLRLRGRRPAWASATSLRCQA